VKITNLLWVTFLCAVVFSAMVGVIKAPETSKFFISDVESGTSISSAKPGSYFSIDVNVNSSDSLFTYQFYLRWNATLLEAVSVEEGEFLNAGGTVETQFTPKIYNATGYLYVACTRLGWGTFGRAGLGTLATVTFLVEKEGESNLDLYSTAPGQRTFFVNDLSQQIEPALEDGLYVYPLAKFNLNPRRVVNATLVAGRSFSIDVNITEADSLYGFEFKLGYNTTMLTATDVELIAFLNQPTYNSSSIDDAAGFVRANVTSQSPAVPRSGSGRIASITFEVEAIGNTDLEFFDTVMIKIDGTSFTHGTLSGSFSNSATTSDISILLSKATITLGESVTISGSISPSRVGVTVTIKYKLAGGSWSALGIETTDSNSEYSYPWQPEEAGTYELQASWEGDANTSPAQSETVTLKVETSGMNLLLYAGIGVVLVAVVGGLIYFFKFRKPSAAS